MSTDAEYEKRFCDGVRKKYGAKPAPMCFVLFPLAIGGPELYSEARRNEIYRRCLDDGRPWQEYTEIVKEVRKWHKAYLKGIEAGEDY